MSAALWILAFLLIGQFLLMPIHVYRTMRQRADACEPYDPEAEPPRFDERELFAAAIPEVERLGFVLVGHYRIRGRNVIQMALLSSPETGDTAAIYSLQGPGTSLRFLELTTRYCDQTSISTNSSSIVRELLAPHPDIRVFKLPEVKDPAHLLELHRALTSKLAGEAERQPHPLDLMAIISQGSVRQLDHQVAAGLMRRLDSGDYAPTVGGACLITWKSCYPVNIICERIARYRMRRMVDEILAEES